MSWIMLRPTMTLEHLGYLPGIVLAHDPRPAREQIGAHYAHGGGYAPFGDGMWVLDAEHVLTFPGDPPLLPLARLDMDNGETCIFYEFDMLAIVQPDGTFAVTRVD